MKILITGGAGFIGSHIAQAYLREGHRVVIVDNLSAGKKERVPAGAAFYHGDISDAEALSAVFKKEKPDAVSHHAAQANAETSVKSPLTDYEANILGMVTVLECCREYGVKRIIFASSAAVYGCTRPAKGGLKEEDALFQISPYGVSKMAGELYLRCYAHLYNLPFVILRYANVYGPYQGSGEAGVVPAFIRALLSEKPCIIFGDGEQTRDYVFVDDVVQANIRALAAGDNGTFNIGTGVASSVNQLAALLREVAGTDSTASITSITRGLVCGPVRGPARTGDIRASVLNSRRAETLLGWSAQTALRDGLKKTLAWFKQQTAASAHSTRSVF